MQIDDKKNTFNEALNEIIDDRNKNAKINKKILKAEMKFKRAEQKKVKKHKREQQHESSQLSKEVSGKKWFYKLKNFIPLSRTSGKIFIIYLLTIIIGGFLLSIPGVVKGDNSWDLVLGTFTASSAFSDTGIVLQPTHSTYTFWGQFLIMVMIQIGGIGILTFKIVVLTTLGKKISINDTTIAQSERGSSRLSNTIEMIKDGFIFLTIIEIIGMVILFFSFYFIKPNGDGDFMNPYQNFSLSLWAAVFHSISAVNNAGFDIISNDSLTPYNSGDSHAYVIQSVFLCQWVIGGLGYPTFHDIKLKIRAKKEGKKAKFSLFTKLNFTVYLALFLLGPLFVYISEISFSDSSQIIYNNGIKNGSSVVFMDIMFNVTATRNAGFSTIDINKFNAGSKLIMSIWMFIGSAPSSTAGGIRTTTFAICCLSLVAIMRNKKQVNIFKKRLPDETIKRSSSVLAISLMLVSLAVLFIFLDSSKVLKYNDGQQIANDGEIIRLLVLVTSAFGTVGFSPYASNTMMAMGVFSKFVLIIVMFIGQLGISNTLLAFIKTRNKNDNKYLEEDVVIG